MILLSLSSPILPEEPPAPPPLDPPAPEDNSLPLSLAEASDWEPIPSFPWDLVIGTIIFTPLLISLLLRFSLFKSHNSSSVNPYLLAMLSKVSPSRAVYISHPSGASIRSTNSVIFLLLPSSI